MNSVYSIPLSEKEASVSRTAKAGGIIGLDSLKLKPLVAFVTT